MNLYIVFQWIDSQLYFQGIFNSEEKAIKECLTDQYCVCPAKLNEELPHEKTKWEGCFYPLKDKKSLQ